MMNSVRYDVGKQSLWNRDPGSLARAIEGFLEQLSGEPATVEITTHDHNDYEAICSGLVGSYDTAVIEDAFDMAWDLTMLDCPQCGPGHKMNEVWIIATGEDVLQCFVCDCLVYLEGESANGRATA